MDIARLLCLYAHSRTAIAEQLDMKAAESRDARLEAAHFSVSECTVAWMHGKWLRELALPGTGRTQADRADVRIARCVLGFVSKLEIATGPSA